MQNVRDNELDLQEVAQSLNGGGINDRLAFLIKAIQDDNLKFPVVYNIADCRVVGGNATFPALPSEKIGLLFLTSGMYEAAVVGGADKWRRLYDGTTFDPAANIP